MTADAGPAESEAGADDDPGRTGLVWPLWVTGLTALIAAIVAVFAR